MSTVASPTPEEIAGRMLTGVKALEIAVDALGDIAQTWSRDGDTAHKALKRIKDLMADGT